ncbi:AP endonuclease [Candidatus Nomurabacteria bacterium RIFCSPLOWO2_01_FULL_42_17]|uniref:AP endonuclease n=1 Tax=Candidatus Nomurabacteria bacterium RIFCSPLOWO2_01_FULL_42_17 TaxID=1801780 RepID=A0A1F6XMI3_9BACT|nr:MAG: AP endonuclease [Candidatus Nomurabacteria bacterium RIFCSPLOWO2_01_FULL_42_17]
MRINGRPKTLFTGQWADLPLRDMALNARDFGYDGLELACWGDHFEVQKADEAYCQIKRKLLELCGMQCHAISAHLVGQAICDNIDERHKAILPAHVWDDGHPENVRRRAAEEMIATIRAARRFGVNVVNGFTGSKIWPLMYSFPPVPKSMIKDGFDDFARRFGPILDVCEECNVNFGLEVHPTEIAFDIASFRTALSAVGKHRRFGINYDPSHLGYQRVDYVRFIYEFADRIFHVHMKDVIWREKAEAGVFGGHTEFHNPIRAWDFKSLGHGNVDFRSIIRALNYIKYTGPLSVEWEDGGMDREHGARESAEFLKKLDFSTSDIVFDEQFGSGG